MRARVLGVVVLVAAVGAVARADDKPLDRTDLDRRIVKVVYETALLGTDLWNKGNKHDECFRVYQGALMALQPMLDHRPKLAASIQAKLDKVRGMKAIEGAFLLREALDEIQNEIAPGAKTDTKVDTKTATLWDRLGGATGVKKIADDLFAQAIEDKKVNVLRAGAVKLGATEVAAVKQKLVELISEATGGPIKYTGPDLKTAFAGMKVTNEEFDAFVAVLKDVLKKDKVAQADADELVKKVEGAKTQIVEGKGM